MPRRREAPGSRRLPAWQRERLRRGADRIQERFRRFGEAPRGRHLERRLADPQAG